MKTYTIFVDVRKPIDQEVLDYIQATGMGQDQPPHPENVASILKKTLNLRILYDNDFTTRISKYINDLVVAQGNEAEIATLPEPYQDASSYQLREVGARFLLDRLVSRASLSA